MPGDFVQVLSPAVASRSVRILFRVAYSSIICLITSPTTTLLISSSVTTHALTSLCRPWRGTRSTTSFPAFEKVAVGTFQTTLETGLMSLLGAVTDLGGNLGRFSCRPRFTFDVEAGALAAG